MVTLAPGTGAHHLGAPRDHRFAMHGSTSGLDTSDEPRRSAILRHARSAFAREGYAGARIEPIAREAGVSTATLYSLFTGKADLFAAVIKATESDFSDQMGLVRTAEGSARQQLLQFATAYARFVADPFVRSVFRLVMAERHRFRTVATEVFEKGREEVGGQLISILRTLDERGELNVTRPSWAAGQLLGMIEHPLLFLPLMTGDEVMPVRDIASIVADAVETFMARHGR